MDREIKPPTKLLGLAWVSIKLISKSTFAATSNNFKIQGLYLGEAFDWRDGDACSTYSLILSSVYEGNFQWPVVNIY